MDEPSSNFAARLLAWKPSRATLMLLFCAALVLRGSFMLSSDDLMVTDPDRYGGLGRGLAIDWTFDIGVPGLRDSVPTALRAPLFPCVLASGYKLAGLLGWADASKFGHILACVPWHLLFGGIAIWGTWWLARAWQLPPIAGLIAATLVTIDPILLGQSVQLMTETTTTALVVLSLIAQTCLAQTLRWHWSFATGIVAGLCALCRPELLLWSVLVLAAIAMTHVDRKRWLHISLIAAVILVMLGPWAYRNYRVFGWPVVTTTHGGYTLLLANNPEFYAHIRDGEWGTTWDGANVYNAWRRALETRGVSNHQGTATPFGWTYDELAADRWAYEQAFKNIRAEPGMFLYSCVVRVGRLWAVLPHQLSPDESTTRRGLRWAVAIWYLFEFALAGAGVWFLGRKLCRTPWLWGTLLVLSLTGVHVFYWTDMRMRAPLVPVVALAAAWGLLSLACRFQSPSAYQQSA